MKKITFLIFIIVIGGAIWFTMRDAPVVPTAPLQITNGKIAGRVTQDADISLYAGLPFAAPPVGDLRWTPPAPVAPWEGVRDATAFSAQCAQYSAGMADFIKEIAKGLGLSWWKQQLAGLLTSLSKPPEYSEDCLYLNVRTGNVGGNKLQPVMVWIHGGSHQTGSGSSGYYQANGLVKRGVVLVTINYRLGPFGYLSHPALSAASPHDSSGNYGTLDQIAALKWVQDNITAFGGDPDNVTLFGESAGAQSVTEVLASPLSAGLMHKAILQSGASSGNLRHLKHASFRRASSEEVGAVFLESLTPTGRNATLTELRAISADALLAQVGANPTLADFYPTVDGWVFPKQIGAAMADGDLQPVEMLAGWNANEGTLFFTGSPTTLQWTFPEGYGTRIAKIKELFGQARGNKLIDLYEMGTEETYDKGATDMLGDDLFGVHMRYLAKQRSVQGLNTYMYFFSRVPPSPAQTIGAFHASEIAFVFDSQARFVETWDEDHALTQAMGAYWTNFTKTGNPNGEDLPQWPAYDAASDEWLNLDHEIKVIANLRKEKLDIIESVLVEKITEARAYTAPVEPVTGPVTPVISEQD